MWSEWLRERGTHNYCPFYRERRSVVLGLTIVSDGDMKYRVIPVPADGKEPKVVGEFWIEGLAVRIMLFEEEGSVQTN